MTWKLEWQSAQEKVTKMLENNGARKCFVSGKICLVWLGHSENLARLVQY